MSADYSRTLGDAVRRGLRERHIESADIAQRLGLTILAVERMMNLERWDVQWSMKVAYAYDFRFEINVLSDEEAKAFNEACR